IRSRHSWLPHYCLAITPIYRQTPRPASAERAIAKRAILLGPFALAPRQKFGGGLRPPSEASPRNRLRGQSPRSKRNTERSMIGQARYDRTSTSLLGPFALAPRQRGVLLGVHPPRVETVGVLRQQAR